MLPQVSAFFGNAVDLDNDKTKQPKFQADRWKHISSAIQTRLGAISDPSLAIQQGMFKAFGNNVLTQGASQAGGMLSDILAKMVSTNEKADRSESSGTSSTDTAEGVAIPIEQLTSVVKDSEDILREMLKTLLRIDTNTVGGVGGGKETKFSPTRNLDKIEANKDRKSAAELLERIEKKNPLTTPQNRPKSPDSSEFSDRLHHISGNVESQMMQGAYNAFGYNVLTQTVTEAGGLASSAMESMSKKFGNGKNSPNVLGESPVSVDLTDKKDTTLLSKILESLTTMNDMFKKFFGSVDQKLSTQEQEFEATIGKPATPKLTESLIPVAGAGGAVVAPEASSLMDMIPDFMGKGKSIPKGGVGTSLGSMGTNLGRAALNLGRASIPAAGTAAAAAAPLAVMYGVTKWAEDTSHDEERVQGIKENAGDPLTNFLKMFGFDKNADIEARRAQNRAELGGESTDNANLNWSQPNKPNGSETLNTAVAEYEKTKEAKPKTEQPTTNINSTTVNNSKTILPSRTVVRNQDPTANRYFNNALSTKGN